MMNFKLSLMMAGAAASARYDLPGKNREGINAPAKEVSRCKAE